MKKKEFIINLMKETNYSEDKCKDINDILESHFIIGKNNKEKIINDFKDKIGTNDEESNDLYDTCVSLLGTKFKNKLKHPFKSKNKE